MPWYIYSELTPKVTQFIYIYWHWKLSADVLDSQFLHLCRNPTSTLTEGLESVTHSLCTNTIKGCMRTKPDASAMPYNLLRNVTYTNKMIGCVTCFTKSPIKPWSISWPLPCGCSKCQKFRSDQMSKADWIKLDPLQCQRSHRTPATTTSHFWEVQSVCLL